MSAPKGLRLIFRVVTVFYAAAHNHFRNQSSCCLRQLTGVLQISSHTVSYFSICHSVRYSDVLMVCHNEHLLFMICRTPFVLCISRPCPKRHKAAFLPVFPFRKKHRLKWQKYRTLTKYPVFYTPYACKIIIRRRRYEITGSGKTQGAANSRSRMGRK